MGSCIRKQDGITSPQIISSENNITEITLSYNT